ncbi:hypothetical protein SSP35_67_00030 [Streptomyces sp. NBRC 110611]|nr:hypothetical protein SSP35_67_00030 [Streptomyces sp. NBRC 110611]
MRNGEGATGTEGAQNRQDRDAESDTRRVDDPVCAGRGEVMGAAGQHPGVPHDPAVGSVMTWRFTP